VGFEKDVVDNPIRSWGRGPKVVEDTYLLLNSYFEITIRFQKRHANWRCRRSARCGWRIGWKIGWKIVVLQIKTVNRSLTTKTKSRGASS